MSWDELDRLEAEQWRHDKIAFEAEAREYEREQANRTGRRPADCTTNQKES